MEECPYCGSSVADQHHKSYATRLVHALSHPLAEVRMRAIIALGLRKEEGAAAALLACALSHPVDVTEGVAVARALGQMLDSRYAVQALTALSECHPARTVRRASRTLLRAGES